MAERILVVTAHPDDAEFFAGGTLIAKARQGAAVRVVIGTDGSWGSFALPADKLAATRREEAQRAAAHYGGEVRFLGRGGKPYRDGSLAGVPFEELCAQVVWHIREFRPTCVATFDPAVLDGHPDHDTIGRVALAAMQFAELPNAYPEHLEAGLSPHIVSARLLFAKDPEHGNTALDITPVMEEKVAALLEHQSQCQFLVTEVLAQARSSGVDLTWFPEDAAEPPVASAIIARAVRDRARAAAARGLWGRLRNWVAGPRYAESFFYTPLPPMVADVATQARLVCLVRDALLRVGAEGLWERLRRQIVRRLT